MMRAGLQPLAHLVDAAAEKWLAVEDAPAEQQLPVNLEITQAFQIGDRAELTFHGQRYLLSIIRNSNCSPDELPQFRVEIHKIAMHG
jgi:hypothetical protein